VLVGISFGNAAVKMSFSTHKNPSSPSHLTEFVPHSDDVKPAGNFLTRLFKKSTGKRKYAF
jgi:hypothetical protein